MGNRKLLKITYDETSKTNWVWVFFCIKLDIKIHQTFLLIRLQIPWLIELILPASMFSLQWTEAVFFSTRKIKLERNPFDSYIQKICFFFQKTPRSRSEILLVAVIGLIKLKCVRYKFIEDITRHHPINQTHIAYGLNQKGTTRYSYMYAIWWMVLYYK